MLSRALQLTQVLRARHPRAAAAVACSWMLVSCHSKTAEPVASPVPVQVTKAVRQTVPVMVQYVAHTQAVQEITLVPRVDGTLDLVAFRDGSLVHKGQLLMRIQQEQYIAAVSAAQGELDKAQANLARAQSNVQDQVAASKLASGYGTSGEQISRLPKRLRPVED